MLSLITPVSPTYAGRSTARTGWWHYGCKRRERLFGVTRRITIFLLTHLYCCRKKSRSLSYSTSTGARPCFSRHNLDNHHSVNTHLQYTLPKLTDSRAPLLPQLQARTHLPRKTRSWLRIWRLYTHYTAVQASSRSRISKRLRRHPLHSKHRCSLSAAATSTPCLCRTTHRCIPCWGHVFARVPELFGDSLVLDNNNLVNQSFERVPHRLRQTLQVAVAEESDSTASVGALPGLVARAIVSV